MYPKINTSKLDCSLSDKARDEFIIECMRFNAKVEVMTALDNLKLSIRKAKEAFAPKCVVCDKPVDNEDMVHDECYRREWVDRDEKNSFMKER